MSDSNFDSMRMQRFIERWQRGDRTAADELLNVVGGRLEQLARKMLRGFPNVRRWADTNDVLQNTLLRLLRTLQSILPKTTRDFLNLAAVHIRRELIDLARRFEGRKHTCVVAGRDLVAGGANDSSNDPLGKVAGPQEEADELELWLRFHQAVEGLPTEEREVVSLTFYHGWTQPQIASLLQVSEKTVRRRWSTACVRLVDHLGGQLPPVAN